MNMLSFYHIILRFTTVFLFNLFVGKSKKTEQKLFAFTSQGKVTVILSVFRNKSCCPARAYKLIDSTA